MNDERPAEATAIFPTDSTSALTSPLADPLFRVIRPYRNLYGPGLQLYIEGNPQQFHFQQLPWLPQHGSGSSSPSSLPESETILSLTPLSDASLSAALASLYADRCFSTLSAYATSGGSRRSHAIGAVPLSTPPMPDFWQQVGAPTTFSGTLRIPPSLHRHRGNEKHPRHNHKKKEIKEASDVENYYFHPTTGAVELCREGKGEALGVRISLYHEEVDENGAVSVPRELCTIRMSPSRGEKSSRTPYVPRCSTTGTDQVKPVLFSDFIQQQRLAGKSHAAVPTSAGPPSSSSLMGPPPATSHASWTRHSLLLSSITGVSEMRSAGLLPFSSSERTCLFKPLPHGGYAGRAGFFASSNGAGSFSASSTEVVVTPCSLLAVMSQFCHSLDAAGLFESRAPSNSFSAPSLWWLSAFRYHYYADIQVNIPFELSCTAPQCWKRFRVAPWRAFIGLPSSDPLPSRSPSEQRECVRLCCDIHQEGALVLSGSFYFYRVGE